MLVLQKATHIHEGEKLLGDLPDEDLPEEDELVDGVGEDRRRRLQKLRKLFQELAVQGLERRTALLDVVGQLQGQAKVMGRCWHNF